MRTIRRLESWWLDVKLGVRMLIKYPGLTLVGGVGIAVGVALAAGGFSAIHGAFLVSSLPLEEGDRVVSIEIWDSAASKPERRILYDYHVWREELKSVQEISAFRPITQNLIAPGVQPVSVSIASMSVSGFRVARVAPLIGRYIGEDDEREGAPPVVMIGENVWRSRFAGDPAILGRSVQLGAIQHSIVGVMPESFAFPVNHRFWTPLRVASAPSAPLTGPDLLVFGRLAPGATLETAQAELATMSQRTTLAFPKIYAKLQPRVMPYANPFMGLHDKRDVTGLKLLQGIFSSMLVLICLNVAVLVYSRTATRQTEIAIRAALGARRSRIVAQLFIEALVLSAVAALAGVAIADFALRQVTGATLSIASELPFWVSFQLSPGAVLYAAALSVLAAAIVGIVPALQSTGRPVQTGLRIIGAGGSGARLGTTWTVLIVAQVGFAVALLPAALSGAWASMRSGFANPGFRAEEFLSTKLEMDGAPDLTRRFAARQLELMRRLKDEPRVAGVTFAMANPGDEATTSIETENSAGWSQTSGHEARLNRVDVDFFRAFDVPILAGRGFEPADLASGSSSIVVNRSFTQWIFAGAGLGRRIREDGRWYEIVGIVSDFPIGANPGLDDSPIKLYHPVAAGQLHPMSMALRVRGGAPSTFAGRLREIAADVDPELHLRNILSLDEVLRREQWVRRLEAAVLLAITLSVLMLSSAGIYALMSITVSQRRKEIGIRMALGADSKRIIANIFSRALGQLAVGAVLGLAAASALDKASGGNLMRGNAKVVLPAVAVFMMAVGFGATLGPALRGLRIEPTEALREQ